INAQCAGGIWTVQDSTIGNFSISWQYNLATNTVQFILKGQAITNVNLSSTYIALGWSDTAPTMDKMDVAIFYPGTQTVEDRFSRGFVVPTVDTQQDFCVIRTNLSNNNVYVAFERFIMTGDPNDIGYSLNVYLMFSMGLYTRNGSSFNIQHHFFRIPRQTMISLINCIAGSCLTTSCNNSCSCLQDIVTNVSKCECFPPSSCISGSTITTRPTFTAPLTSTMMNNTITNSSTTTTISTLLTTQASIITIINATSINSNPGTCQSNPCLASGICLQISVNEFVCRCINNSSGNFCQIPPTLSSNSTLCPCLNGGICLSSTNATNNGSTTCACSNQFLGQYCQLANPCLGYCRNNGACSVVCSETSCNTPNCTCLAGFSGISCALGMNACYSNPCKNGGQCVNSSTGTYQCQCLSPYAGTNCDTLINVCTPNPCKNNGTCVTGANIQDRPYRCDCINGFAGSICEYGSACNSNLCRNNGMCVPDTTNCVGTFCGAACVCLSGTTGPFCEIQNSTCSSQPCLNGGVCISTGSGYQCQCNSLTTGVRCETTIQSSCSSNNPCFNGGTCYLDAVTNALKCICSQSYTGQYCQSSVSSNVCLSNPCSNNGTCVSNRNIFFCICPAGFGGVTCQSGLIPCTLSPCRYLSTCQQLNTNPLSFTCLCPDFLTGDRCQYPNKCHTNPCFNQGTCIPLGPQNSFVCICPPGFAHYDCSVYLGNCTSNACINGGLCDYSSTSTKCSCLSGFSGPRCEWNSVCSSNTCQNGGMCRQIAPTMAECLCSTGYTNNPCLTQAGYCQNGGTCVTSNTDPPVITCLCRPGFTAPRCSPLQLDVCQSNPCQTRGYCAPSASNTSYKCVCSSLFAGDNCERNNPCVGSPCLNNAICQPSWNTSQTWFNCVCVGTYTGTRCETSLLYPCGGLCMNGSPCVNGVCQCSAQYTGVFCAFDNPCLHRPCRNDGYCTTNYNSITASFTCTCLASFTGILCETYVALAVGTICNPSCQNNAVCVNGACLCTADYLGPVCQYPNPCNFTNPCLNGGTCFGHYSNNNNNNGTVSTQCFCPQGYTGVYCEAGKTGDRCQYADVCSFNPCKSNEICQQTGNQYQCNACYDRSPYCATYKLRTEYCTNQYTMLISGSFIPVPVACQSSCGQCIQVQRYNEFVPSATTNTTPAMFQSNTSESATSSSTDSSSSSLSNIIISRDNSCYDEKPDCPFKKQVFSCQWLDTYYPSHCAKTCNPACSS
ncbi:unnamed protein product, partial [Didymodactylos carnosus]